MIFLTEWLQPSNLSGVISSRSFSTVVTYYYQLLSWKTLRAFYLFNQSNYSHPSLEVVYLFLSQKEWHHPFFEVYCAVFICFTICCHSLSLIAICCHSLPFVVPLVVICCHSLYHSLSLDVPLVCLFINDLLISLPEARIKF